jgi:hypothetical protein
MRRQFRERPLDLYKNMPLLRQNRDQVLVFEDESGNIQRISQLDDEAPQARLSHSPVLATSRPEAPYCRLPLARVSQLWDRFHAHIRMRFRRRHVPLCLIRIRG